MKTQQPPDAVRDVVVVYRQPLCLRWCLTYSAPPALVFQHRVIFLNGDTEGSAEIARAVLFCRQLALAEPTLWTPTRNWPAEPRNLKPTPADAARAAPLHTRVVLSKRMSSAMTDHR